VPAAAAVVVTYLSRSRLFVFHSLSGEVYVGNRIGLDAH
jgi:hypothetical protein